ncbi:MAG: YbhN family protein [Acidimicrobiales bacterium]
MSTHSPTKHRSSKISLRHQTWFWIRTAITIGLLGLLIWKIPRDQISEVGSEWNRSSLLWLLGSLGFMFIAFVLAAMRWKVTLETMGVHRSTSSLLRHTLAGQFVGNVLPTTIGGDALRVHRLGKEIDHVPHSFASVVLERLSGWVVLPLITLIAFVINPGLLRLDSTSRLAAVIAFISLIALTGLLALSTSRVASKKFGAHSEGWRRLIGATQLGLTELRHAPRMAIKVLLIGAAYQLAVLTSTLLAAKSLSIELSPTAVLAFIPIVLIAQVLPLSIAGFGLREGALVLFLRPVGVSAAQAVLLGFLLYTITLVVSLLGAPSFARGAQHQPEKQPS